MGPSTGRLRNYFIAGVLTVIPVWITWVVFRFVVDQLSSVGRPWVFALSRGIQPYSPETAELLLNPWFENGLAVALTVIALLLLGWGATLVIGKRLLAAFDALVHRIPLIEKIYGSSKALISAFQQRPDEVQRVVLIDFPKEGMKAVGFVTRTLTAHGTGEELAAVYVPTTPNPTSGYLEIVPVSQLVSTDWTIDEAMTFVITGGTVGPDVVHFHGNAEAPPAKAERLGS